MLSVRKIKTLQEAKHFTALFKLHSGHEIPATYFWKNNTYIIENKKGIVAGFSFIIESKKRVIEQIPHGAVGQDDIMFYSKHSQELTGLFYSKENRTIFAPIYYSYKILTAPTKLFVLSYDSNNAKLAKHYSKAKPFLIYSGIVRNLEGMTGKHFEDVVTMTKIGFIVFLINRFFGKLLNGNYTRKKSDKRGL